MLTQKTKESVESIKENFMWKEKSITIPRESSLEKT